MKSVIYLFSMLIIVLIAFNAKAQEPYSQHFSISNGLPSNSIYSLLEDREGFIWFTCDEGLFRYDGTHYKWYRSKLQTSYSGSSLTQDHYGRIWYINFDGSVFYIKNDELVEFSQKTKVDYYSLKHTKNVIFIQEKERIVAVDLKTLNRIKSFNINGFVNSFEVIKNALYYIDDHVLYRINENLEKHKIASLPFFKSMFPLLVASQGHLYLVLKNSSDNNIWKLEGAELKPMDSLHSIQVIQHVRIIKNHLFLLTSKGVCSYELPNFSNKKCYFPSKNITDVLLDRKGNYWLASSMDGLDIVPDLNVKLFQFDGILPLRSVNYNEQLLISSKNEKVLFFRPEAASFETFLSGTANTLPYYLFIDKKRDELVRVQSDGYSYFTDIQTKKLRFKTNFAIKHIVLVDKKYRAFASTGFNGFYCYKSDLKVPSKYDKWISNLEKRDEGEIIFYRIPAEGRGKKVFINPENEELYFMVNTGTYHWKEGVVKKITFSGKVTVLNNMFWWNNHLLGLGIDGRILDLKEPKHTANNALLGGEERIKQVKIYKDKLYLRSTLNLNIYKINSNEKTVLVNSFDLSTLECNDFSIIDNSVWIMTSNGIINWDYVQQKENTIAGKFVITSIKINGSKTTMPKNKTLRSDENNLTIDFSILDFGIRSLNNLEYKINDGKWVTIDPLIRTLSLPALAPGDYAIQIRGFVNGELTNFQKLTFTIKPPFYSTAWFLIITFSLITLLVIWYYRNQLKRNKTRDRLINEKIVLESNLNKSLLASIKSQMNPHFIFNALNTIQAYIYMNDRDNASGYLSKFSKLTRSILEMSEKDEVSLSEEINALKLYLDLEKMRFQEGFLYTISTEDISIDSIKIPSMLIQPYVENAIKHGLLHSENEKKVSVHFSQKERFLFVEIDDNGIGRKRAEEMRMHRDKFHSGFSTQANEKRLKLLGHEDSVVVTFIDKYDQNNQALGTTVKLTIQLK